MVLKWPFVMTLRKRLHVHCLGLLGNRVFELAGLYLEDGLHMTVNE